MKQVQIQALDKAISILNALKVQYKVILENGTEYGGLEVVKPKTRKRLPKAAYASYTDLYKNPMNEIDVGDVFQIPIDKVNAITNGNPDSLRSAITAHACHIWGKGNYTSTITDTHVEIMRLG